MLNDYIFGLFIQVMNAARNGNYMFGNGADWYIVENNKKLHINTVSGSVDEVPNYNGTPVVDMGTYNNLYRFLMQSDMQSGYDSTFAGFEYRHAIRSLIEACEDGRVLFTNGGQWYVSPKNHKNTVMVYETSVRGTVKVHQMSYGASWRYMQNTNTFQHIGQDTIDFLARL